MFCHLTNQIMLKIECPDGLRYWSADEAAECLPSLSEATYAALWKVVSESEAAGTDKPPGGDGSDGTTEEPIVSDGQYGTDLVAAWDSLTEDMKIEICLAAKAGGRDCDPAPSMDLPLFPDGGSGLTALLSLDGQIATVGGHRILARGIHEMSAALRKLESAEEAYDGGR